MDYFILLGFLVAFAAAEETELTLTESPAVCNCSHLLLSEESTEVYPTFPSTSFTCWGRYDGYYADTEVDCTIFHYCQTWQFPTGLNETVKWDFACPQSTIFNQKILSCTPPNNSFDCQDSPNWYWVNYYNFTTTQYTTPNPETTPGSNFGQQLIIGGVGAQSAEYQESSDPTPVPTDSDSSPQSAGIHEDAHPTAFPTDEGSSPQSAKFQHTSESASFPSDPKPDSGSFSQMTKGYPTESIYYPPSTPPSYFDFSPTGFESAGYDSGTSLPFTKDPESVIHFPHSTPFFSETSGISKSESHSGSGSPSSDTSTADYSRVETVSYKEEITERFESNLVSSSPSKAESEKKGVDFPNENFIKA